MSLVGGQGKGVYRLLEQGNGLFTINGSATEKMARAGVVFKYKIVRGGLVT